jgi:hypothetical protein
MSYTRITSLLPSKSTVKAGVYTGFFIALHIAAWLDREQDNENDPPISLSLLSKIAVSAHTAAVAAEMLDDFSMVSIHSTMSKYKAGGAAMLAGSAATLAGVWATADSRANMVLGVVNASSNFVGRLFSGAHRKAVMSENVVNFDHLEQKAQDDMENGEAYNSLPAPSA